MLRNLLVCFAVSIPLNNFSKLKNFWDFPGGSVVKTLYFHGRGHRFDYCQGTKITHAMWCGQKIKITFLKCDLKVLTHFIF